MEIRQLEYFVSIVDHGSFTAAADDQFISQSSISKKIIELEKELGVSLFDRSKRKVSLAKAGDVFLVYAREFLSLYRRTIVELSEFKSEDDIFTIGAIPVIAQYGIAAHIAEFREVYPNISFTLEEVDGLNVLPALDEFRFDLAITRDNFLDESKYAHLEIYKDQLLVVVSKKNPYVNRFSISMKELSNDNFIVFDKVTDLHKLIIEECRNSGFEPTIFYSSHRKVSVFSLIGANIGIALIPSKVYEYHKHPDVVAIPLEETIECNLVLVYLKNRKLPRTATGFIEFLHNQIKERENEQNL